MKKTLVALTASLALLGCATAKEPAPEALLHYQTIAAVSANQTTAETNRLLAITAIAQGGDERVKDRALAELERGAAPSVNVTQWQAPPNAFLQFLGIVAQPLAILGNAAIQADTAVKLDTNSTIRHGITFGTMQGIAQGGYNLGAQGIQSTQALGAAGIAKIPSITVHAAPVAAPAPAPADVPSTTE